MIKIGIYALYWEQNSMVYIGKGTPINNRVQAHKNLLKNMVHYNYKLQDQYNKYGEPQIIVLEETSEEPDYLLENSWIMEFNSVEDGLNIVYSNAENCPFSGTNSNTSKYSKTQVLKVFSLLYKGKLGPVEIANRVKVDISLPNRVRHLGQHIWLKLQYPDKYQIMLNNTNYHSKSKVGIKNPMSKYSEWDILKVFSLLYKTTLSRYKIATRTGVKEGTVKDIINNGGHSWLKEKYPEQYIEMLRVRKTIGKKRGFLSVRP